MEDYTFKDRHGNKWDASLTLAGAKRIDAYDYALVANKDQDPAVFTILDPGKGFFEEVLSTPAVLWAMLFQVVKPQVKKLLNIDPEQNPIEAEVAFCDGLLGKTMEDAREAFWESIANFFPESKTALLMLAKIQKEANKKIGGKLRTMEPKIRELFNTALDTETKKVEANLEELLMKNGSG